MDNIWNKYSCDFNAMSDSEIEAEASRAQDAVDEQTEWLEAVASWKSAGKPRDGERDNED